MVLCSRVSSLCLLVMAASVEKALEKDNIVVACITEYSPHMNRWSQILDDAKIVTVRCCDDDCASVILKDKDIDTIKIFLPML